MCKVDGSLGSSLSTKPDRKSKELCATNVKYWEHPESSNLEEFFLWTVEMCIFFLFRKCSFLVFLDLAFWAKHSDIASKFHKNLEGSISKDLGHKTKKIPKLGLNAVPKLSSDHLRDFWFFHISGTKFWSAPPEQGYWSRLWKKCTSEGVFETLTLVSRQKWFLQIK